MQKLIKMSGLAMAALVWASVAQADSITLYRTSADATFYPGGYNGVADNTIYYYSPGTAHASYPNGWMRSSDGANNPAYAQNSGGGSRRSLLRFDLSGMSGQNVQVTTDATITLRGSGGSTGLTVGLYEIAPANAGWQESTLDTNNSPSAANNGDPTWFYKSIDATLPWNTSVAADTTSVKWASGHVNIGNAGSNPEGYANTGGLWNDIDLIDQNPGTAVTSYLDMDANMDPVATAIYPGSALYTFTIPAAMIQDWIDNPGDNAGLLVRSSGGTGDIRFISAEAGTKPNGPNLSFDYMIVPEPSTLSLLSLGMLGFLRRRR